MGDDPPSMYSTVGWIDRQDVHGELLRDPCDLGGNSGLISSPCSMRKGIRGFLYVWDKHHRGTCAIMSFADPSRKSKETFAAVSWSIAYAVAGWNGTLSGPALSLNVSGGIGQHAAVGSGPLEAWNWRGAVGYLPSGYDSPSHGKSWKITIFNR